jgi:hypothetical protein
MERAAGVPSGQRHNGTLVVLAGKFDCAADWEHCRINSIFSYFNLCGIEPGRPVPENAMSRAVLSLVWADPEAATVLAREMW